MMTLGMTDGTAYNPVETHGERALVRHLEP
jgi:hypothetical protein